MPVLHALIMVAAALGWGVYSLVGRRSGEPLRATAANFVLAVPICWAGSGSGAGVARRRAANARRGVVLAVVSGVVTSGLGYALWYSVLPRLQASVAAVAQLTVPVIAMAGGMVFLGEVLTRAVCRGLGSGAGRCGGVGAGGALAHDRFQRVVMDRAAVPGDAGQAVGFEADSSRFRSARRSGGSVTMPSGSVQVSDRVPPVMVQRK